ncbi:NAD(P)H-dependent glycerol-3-phosphate dehydrogenase [Gracilimonas mengyeensis]|uniref:Glycerol-3-phosphate dehydrogenase [NAD(P)+] n=1 Tax=Gracilimonas mengyeensis TaxID=1302730 RepID=A0A521DF68_9BACT|nr:NAD(P)H-dependent glycerol-3-phosphate dehydrogenase [Gracilimonas mengyeensis]SMO69590.1 glycerol 3-phosphate dehydrogenase (NAD(P)+) [Gracilimonas mengyeensis]
MSNKNVTIIGAGSFGTALAMVLDQAGNNVQIWAREPEVAQGINENHINPSYLSDIKIPETIKAYNNLEQCLQSQDIILFATPSHALRDVANKLKPCLDGHEILVTVAKGIENDTFKTMSQVLVEVMEGTTYEDNIGVLYGPSHAEEVGLFKPTTVVSAAYSTRTARIIQETFLTPMFRVYINNDVIGVEIGGSVKNIMAIAAGIVDGAELGDNAKAALITRGLHEMKRMGVMLGAHSDTFSGLTGMGDLIVTCTSSHSRNRSVGYRIGKGEKLDDIIKSMNMVAEGIKTAKSVRDWSVKNKVEMPITHAVYRVLFEDVDPSDVLYELMTRDPKDEIVM